MPKSSGPVYQVHTGMDSSRRLPDGGGERTPCPAELPFITIVLAIFDTGSNGVKIYLIN
jgi:hypothetical protein